MSRSKRKLSLVTTVLLITSLGTMAYLPIAILFDLDERRDRIVQERTKRLAQHITISQALYQAGAEQDLAKFLQNLMANEDISYFAVYRGKDLIQFKPEHFPLATNLSFEQRLAKMGHDINDEERGERSELLSSDTLITMGVDKQDSGALFDIVFKSDLWKLALQDILMIIAMSAFAFWLHTRDLMRLKREIAKHGRVPDAFAGHLHGTLSAETETIIAGLKGYAQAEKHLQEKSDRLSAQVLPALKRELFSGQTPPYTFECTLVRTDINGFSQIFNSPYRDRFAKHVDDFFIGLTEIVSRYDGLIYEFVGDEAIFYFKDYTGDDFQDQLGPSTSINRAIDAIRDIHTFASDIGLRTKLEGHRFTVKSALAHGTLRFGPQVDGFSLSGGVLIETVRILSNVTEKHDNHLYFASRHSGHLRDDSVTEKVGVFSLKGYSEDVTVVRWVGSTPLSTHIANVNANGFEFISQHRSDFSLETVIAAAASARDSWSLKQHLALVHALRSVKVFRAHHPLAEALIDWVSAGRSLAEQSAEWNHLVSAILMIFPTLVPKQALSQKAASELENLLDSEDTRTVANTIDMFTRYQIEPKARPLGGLLINANNRIAANSLIHLATRELTDETIKKIDAMIFARNIDDARRASGLYALGEIARILRTRDPVYYSTRVELHHLIERASTLIDHPNESVASQAARTLAKADIAPSLTSGPTGIAS